MKKTFSFFFFLFQMIFAFSQQNKIDSLENAFHKSPDDTNKINLMFNLLVQYKQIGNYDKTSFYCNSILTLSEKLNYKNGIAFSYNATGTVNLEKGNYPEALKYYFLALKVYEEIKSDKGKGNVYNNIGNTYGSQENYEEALKNYSLSLEIRKRIGDKRGIAILSNNIGLVYWGQNKLTEALEKFLSALKLFEEIGDRFGMGYTYNEVGAIYLKQNNYQKALEYHLSSLKILEELDDKIGITSCYINIGSANIKLNNLKEAKKYLLDGLSLAKQNGVKEQIRDSYKALYDIDSLSGNYQQALDNYRMFVLYKDSMLNERNTKKIVQAQMNYEFDKKEAVANAEHKKELENQQIIADEKSRKQKVISFSIALGLLFVIVFAGFIFRSLRITRKQKQIIEVQKSEVEKSKHIIEEKNKNITDSINYAKRIQQAKLPSKEVIYSALPDSFVLFKPKDIVSGDFYFFHQTQLISFIASADCTGHGVPGALMSMIGSEKLDDALAHSADTSEILSLLNKGIKSALKQSETDETATRDGMDIALCSVDTNARVVKYAGANRPIWIIRNGQTAVEEIKATKKAIGGFTEDSQHFDTHEIKFEQGDTFYISTDGFADTFGGAEQKKVTTKRFKEILLSIQDKTMKEQELHLENFIEDWKGGSEQIDDILVIGVRL